MKRYQKSLMFLALAWLSISWVYGQPNVIFIMADDLGYGDLQCYGQTKIQTPYIDRLAREGMKFTQVYAGAPVCAPSRSVLMTGMHTGHTTVRGNTGVGGVQGLGGRQGRVPLRDEDYTIAELAQLAGYVTGMVGKWGLGEPGTSGEPRKQGFDYFYGFLNQRRAHSYYTQYLWENENRDSFPINLSKDSIYAHDVFTAKSLDFIREYKDTAFFLYLPYTIPHDKYEIPSLFPYQDSTDWGEKAQIHAAMVTRMDRDIGRIMHQLNALDLRDDTAIFFCSDNGAAQRWEGIFDSSGKLQGRKRDLYEGGIRTPMIVSWPREIVFNTESHEPWHFMDVMPTLASLMDAPVPNDIDGIDVSHLFLQKSSKISRRTLYWEFYERGFQQAVRWGKWKGIKLSADQPWELYDLESDVSEALNIAKQYPGIVSEISSIAESSHIPSAQFPRSK